ncbi:hypothetical protein [Indiicoccus explosivorum]|uniref:hypothetical protein n=1 Tax=Indiicoccus explosivorum TaxID=1917864 RepID=UPI000B4490A6|nr:hypothetical protein [Indiicoccus explosivorum]
MDSVFHLRDFVYILFIVGAFLVSWRLGILTLDKRGKLLPAIAASLLSGALILFAGGTFGEAAEPDLIGKGLVPFMFFLAFIGIGISDIILLLVKWTNRKHAGPVP